MEIVLTECVFMTEIEKKYSACDLGRRKIPSIIQGRAQVVWGPPWIRLGILTCSADHAAVGWEL